MFQQEDKKEEEGQEKSNARKMKNYCLKDTQSRDTFLQKFSRRKN